MIKISSTTNKEEGIKKGNETKKSPPSIRLSVCLGEISSGCRGRTFSGFCF